jgi:type IX secretion system PorP/SprF family membrane protein
MRKVRYAVLIIFIIWQGLSIGLLSQQSLLTTQYMDNPLLLNPAFAGNRNSMAVDVFSRQQWMGVEGAPSSYYAGFHLPFNNSTASVGTTILSNQVGPLMYNKLTFDYAYLLRITRRSFLSLGIRAGVDHFNLNLTGLPIIDFNDPEFAQGIENEFRPAFGAGLVFFKPSYYLSVSLPHFPLASVPWASESAENFKTTTQLNFTGGFHFNISRDINIKMSGMRRMVFDEISTTDVSIMLRHNEGFRGGITHRLNQSAGLLFGMQVTDEIGFLYSYEFPISADPIVKKGVHEISITFDFTKHIIPNRNRRFLHRKKKEQQQDEEMNSIRYF